jgi:threonyl-tRNA synthetase
MVMHVFETLGFKDYECRISLRDPNSTKYVGDPANWDRAEETLRKVAKDVGIKHFEGVGEAAFYGPKIDFMVKDVIGRTWQLGTVQLDYNLPERFQLEYIGADNARHRPVMIHRAPFGSMERFTGILIEHFAGAFPTWLSPVQVVVMPISEKFNDYAKLVLSELAQNGIRAELDASNDKIGAKIRRAREAKVPYMFVVGAKEAETNMVSVRTRKDKDLGARPLKDFLETLKTEIRTRALPTE